MHSKPTLHEIILPPTTEKVGHHVAYAEWGDPHNPEVLFCVHGLSRNSRDFDYIAAALETQYRVISVDVVGRGKSAWLTDKQQYNYATYVADIVALLDALQLKHVDWLGTSMGGLIGMMLAAHFPDRIKRMIMNDIGPFIPSATLTRIAKYVGITPNFSHKSAAENHLRTVMAPFGIKKEEHWEHIFTHSLTQQENGHWILSYDPAIASVFKGENGEGLGDVDLWNIWEKVLCDVLVLRGAVSDALLPETARRMQLSGPRAKLVEFPDIGHAPALMEEDQIQVVRHWLTRNA